MANKVTIATYRQKIATISVMISNSLNMIDHQLFMRHLKKNLTPNYGIASPLSGAAGMFNLLLSKQ
jgi:hypothetical protein